MGAKTVQWRSTKVAPEINPDVNKKKGHKGQLETNVRGAACRGASMGETIDREKRKGEKGKESQRGGTGRCGLRDRK